MGYSHVLGCFFSNLVTVSSVYSQYFWGWSSFYCVEGGYPVRIPHPYISREIELI